MARTKIKLTGDPKSDLDILFKECSNNNQICYHIKKNKPLVDYLKQETGLDKEPMVLLYHFKEGIKEIPKCVCGSERQYHCYGYRPTCAEKNCQSIVREESKKKFCLENYGVEFVTQLDTMKEKSKQSCLEKFGVDNYSKTDEYKEKVQKTNLERYGVNWLMKSEKIRKKSYESMIDLYGVKTPIKSDEIFEKIKITNLERYGVDNVLKSKSIREKIKNTTLSNYGTDSLFKNEEYRRENFKIAQNISYIKYIGNKISLFKCDQNKDHIFEIEENNFCSRLRSNLPLCTICYPIGNKISIKESQLFDFVKSIYSGQIIQSYRDEVEIDIYLPELNIGFEFNGLYWHSDSYLCKYYHLDKKNHFKDRGIKIINIWEDDWDYKNDIIKSQIRNFIGLNQIIYARECQIREVSDTKVVKDFLNQNHIQGYVNSKLKIGLYFDSELVCLMTFDQFEGRKKLKEGEWNLSRFCNRLNTSTIGGASKLLKYFTKTYNPTRIISYADNDWSKGNLYEKLGFQKIHETKPDYKYLVNKKRIHKSRYRKSVTGISESNLNIPKIWDCGKIKFELNTI